MSEKTTNYNKLILDDSIQEEEKSFEKEDFDINAIDLKKEPKQNPNSSEDIQIELILEEEEHFLKINEIQTLFCKYKIIGCRYYTNFNDAMLQMHENSCSFKVDKCTLCEEPYLFNKGREHNNNCPKILLECLVCQKKYLRENEHNCIQEKEEEVNENAEEREESEEAKFNKKSNNFNEKLFGNESKDSEMWTETLRKIPELSKSNKDLDVVITNITCLKTKKTTNRIELRFRSKEKDNFLKNKRLRTSNEKVLNSITKINLEKTGRLKSKEDFKKNLNYVCNGKNKNVIDLTQEKSDASIELNHSKQKNLANKIKLNAASHSIHNLKQFDRENHSAKTSKAALKRDGDSSNPMKINNQCDFADKKKQDDLLKIKSIINKSKVSNKNEKSSSGVFSHIRRDPNFTANIINLNHQKSEIRPSSHTVINKKTQDKLIIIKPKNIPNYVSDSENSNGIQNKINNKAEQTNKTKIAYRSSDSYSAKISKWSNDKNRVRENIEGKSNKKSDCDLLKKEKPFGFDKDEINRKINKGDIDWSPKKTNVNKTNHYYLNKKQKNEQDISNFKLYKPQSSF